MRPIQQLDIGDLDIISPYHGLTPNFLPLQALWQSEFRSCYLEHYRVFKTNLRSQLRSCFRGIFRLICQKFQHVPPRPLTHAVMFISCLFSDSFTGLILSLHFFLFWLVFLPSLACSYEIYCNGQARPPTVPFQSSDCRFILAHLPSGPSPNASVPPFSFSTNLPFLPRARFIHGTCEVRVRYDAPLDDAQPPFTHTHLLDLRDIPITLEVYSAMKSIGEEILEECVEIQTMTGGQVFGQTRGISWSVTLTLQEALGNAVPWWYSRDRARALVSGRTDAIKWRGLTRWGVTVFEL